MKREAYRVQRSTYYEMRFCGVVNLKPVRNLQVIVTGIVVGSLFLGGLAELQGSGIGAGLFLGGICNAGSPLCWYARLLGLWA